MSEFNWTETFQKIFEKAVAQYRGGNEEFNTYFNEGEKAFLASIGHSVKEIGDFAEDHVENQAPDFATVLLVAAARRDYFLVLQHGKASSTQRTLEEFPAKDAELAGIPWLPRIIEKARAKLRGELPYNLMYACGGDLRFLKKYDLHPADFLRTVWSAGENTEKIVAYVEARAKQAAVV